jgi:hypothetical protein
MENQLKITLSFYSAANRIYLTIVPELIVIKQ